MAACFICSSNRFVDDHHVDCQEGKHSPETVPLCRRCHRTYHDWGVEWFDDEYLDRAIEIENKAREIYAKAGIKGYFYHPEIPIRRRDVKRSDYWYKKHGIRRRAQKVERDERAKQLELPLAGCLRTSQ